MATVGELSAPYENHLRRVLPNAPGVCAVCHTSVIGSYPRCFQCNSQRTLLSQTANAVAFVALAVKGEQLARELWVYKGDRVEARRLPAVGLAAVLWRWLSRHEKCLADQADVDEFPIVTTIPSTRGRTDHPLNDVVGGMVGPTRDRHRVLLAPRDPSDGSREAKDDRFVVDSNDLNGQPVLIIDDTWTTGGHAQSAAAAIRHAGSGPTAILAIGRHFAVPSAPEEYREAAREYLRQAPIRSFSWDVCCLCGSG